MRATMNISLKVGLVVAPEVKVYAAIDSGEKISMNMLHAECQHKVEQRYFCPLCAKEIVDKKAEIVKGYPTGKEEWIVLTEAEIESCKKESNGVMDCFQFVENGAVAPILYQKPYYLEAGKKGAELFGLIYQGISENGVSGLAKMVSKQKDHFYLVTPYQGILVAYELHFPNEVRETTEIERPQVGGFDDATVTMFKTLIQKMTRPYDRDKARDEYTEALRAIINAKAAGQVIDISVPIAKKQSLSLKDALAASLAQAA
jgi:DNA end-binding protein Ku